MRSTLSKQDGVALALDVWFVAGMTLLVGGIVSYARVDARMTEVHLARAKAIAAGDGAITLAMAERRRGYDSSAAGPLISESVHRIGDLDVRVRLFPAVGFIDLNRASREVLAVLFAFSGVLARDQAQTVADNVVKWRDSEASRQGSRRASRNFYAVEDLLRVEGVTRQLLDGIRDYVVAGEWTSGTMNWGASPQEIIGLLESLEPGRVDTVVSRRENMMRTAGGQSGQRIVRAIESASAFRADAVVSYGDKQWLRRRWLVLETSAHSSLPWRVVRTEPPRVVRG